MTKEVRATRAAYMRAWRKKNPDKERMYREKYWKRKYEQYMASLNGTEDRKANQKVYRTNCFQYAGFMDFGECTCIAEVKQNER